MFCKFSAFSLEFQKFSWSLEQFFSLKVRTILETKYEVQHNEKRGQKIISYTLFNFSGWNFVRQHSKRILKSSGLWKNFLLKYVKYYTISSATSPKMLQRQNFNVSLPPWLFLMHRWSTCVLVCFSWLLNYVVYLKLSRK